MFGQPKERGYRWSGDAGGIGGSCSQLVPFQLPLSGDTGSFPKSGDTGGFWSSKCLVPTVSGDIGGIWNLKSQFHGLSGALGGICNLGNGCQELSGDVGGICDLGSRIQDLSGDRGWNIRPVENKWKSSFYPWSTRIPATLVLWYVTVPRICQKFIRPLANVKSEKNPSCSAWKKSFENDLFPKD